MAKQIISTNYIFDPSRKLVIVDGNILQERLLIITNVTLNKIIYNFSDPLLGLFTDPVYYTDTNQTYIYLKSNMSGMKATDKLQIFIEEEFTRFAPDDTYLDPVSKIRVSTPENLIDTDFEYGLQSSKWETLELVNNIPTFYARTGDTPLQLESVTTTADSSTVRVSLNPEIDPFTLISGTPVEISNLTDARFEGSFLIDTVDEDSKSFTYKVGFKAATSDNLYTVYTSVIPGAFYTGSSLKIREISSDSSNPSTINILTEDPHGFLVNTSTNGDITSSNEFYLTNTIGTKKINFEPTNVYGHQDPNYPTSVGIGSTVLSLITVGAGASLRQTNSFFNLNTTTYGNLKFINALAWHGPYVNTDGTLSARSGTLGGNNVSFERLLFVNNTIVNPINQPIALVNGSQTLLDFGETGSGGVNVAPYPQGSPVFVGVPTGNNRGGSTGIGSFNVFEVATGIGRTIGLTSTGNYNINDGAAELRNFTSVTHHNGPLRLIKAWQINSYNASNYYIELNESPASLPNGQKVVIVPRWDGRRLSLPTGVKYASEGASGSRMGALEQSPNIYYVNKPNVGNNIRLAKTSGEATTWGSKTVGIALTSGTGLTNLSSTVAKMYIVPISEVDDFNMTTGSQVKHTIEFASNHNFVNNDYVRYYDDITANGGTTLTGLVDGEFYHVEVVNERRIRLKTKGNYLLSSNSTKRYIPLTGYGNNFSNPAVNTTVEKTVTNLNRESIQVDLESGIVNNSIIRYEKQNSTTGLTTTKNGTVSELTSGIFYTAKIGLTSAIVPENKIHVRLSPQATQTFQAWGWAGNGIDVNYPVQTRFGAGIATDKVGYSTNVAFGITAYGNGTNGGWSNPSLSWSAADIAAGIGSTVIGIPYIKGWTDAKVQRYSEFTPGDTIVWYDVPTGNSPYNDSWPNDVYQVTDVGYIKSGTNAWQKNYKVVYVRVPTWKNKTALYDFTKKFSYPKSGKGPRLGSIYKCFDFVGIGNSTQALLKSDDRTLDGTYKITSIDDQTISCKSLLEIPTLTRSSGVTSTNNTIFIGTRLITGVAGTGGAAASALKGEALINLDTVAGISVGDEITGPWEEGVTVTRVGYGNTPTFIGLSTGYSRQGQTLVAGVSTAVVLGISTCLRYDDHKFLDGIKIIYNADGTAGASAFVGLTSNTEYYVVVRDKNWFGLASSYENAIARIADSTDQIVGFFSGSGINNNGSHFYTSSNVNGSIVGPGTIFVDENTFNITDGYLYSTGVSSNKSTQFLSFFSAGDSFVGFTTRTQGPGDYFEGTIQSVKSDYVLSLKENPIGFGTQQASYFIRTSVYPKSNSTSLHKPYDGGVRMQTGLSSSLIPNSTLVRQTRRYFRYQSGKGIQCSIAINFNPPFDVDDLRSSSGIATVTTKEEHGMIVGLTTYKIRISEAESPDLTKVNYNGVFEVIDTPSSNSFTYKLPVYNFVGIATSGSNLVTGITTFFRGNISIAKTDIITGIGSTAINLLQPGMRIRNLDYGIVDSRILSVDKFNSESGFSHAITIEPYVGLGTGTNIPLEIMNILDFVPIGGIVTSLKTATGISSNIKITEVDRYERTVTLSSPMPSAVGVGTSCDFFATSSESLVISSGFPKFNFEKWQDATVRCGLFDFQNGMFFEYNGQDLYCVRRTSTQQLSGSISLESGSNLINGYRTKFNSQLNEGDFIILRGQSYRVVKIDSDDALYVQPFYRGASITNVVATKTVDQKVRQKDWNIDKCDGKGKHGYNLDINKIQMVYMDYSWYGAGKIRFGFKNQDGEVRYVHEFVHNNRLTEAYLRSGNLPGRYEVATGNAPSLNPSLFHWGTSVIMDGRYDDDKAYLFTADSNTLTFSTTQTQFKGNLKYGSSWSSNPNDWRIENTNLTTVTGITSARIGSPIDAKSFPSLLKDGTVILKASSTYKEVYLSQQPQQYNTSSIEWVTGTSSASNDIANLIPLPLVSIRLAPSVDSGLTGNLGFRDLINRMQLTLKSTGVLVTHDSKVELILNGQLSNDEFNAVQQPALSQLYKHRVADRITGGTVIYSFRASGGAIIDNTTKKRSYGETSVALDELAVLGNSILGGEQVFPNGPDILTVCVTPIDTSEITSTSPYSAQARITWTESQA